MMAHVHLMFVFCCCLGAFLGGFLIDLDHGGTIKQKWNCFKSSEDCGGLKRGIFHNPKVAFPIIGFMVCFSLAYFFHIMMDLDWRAVMK